jgi:hypothetical protein
MSMVSQIVWFLWSTFAPEQAQEEAKNIVKDFIRVLIWMIVISFLLGALSFAGTYFLAQWMLASLQHAVLCYFIASVFTLFFTLIFLFVGLKFLVNSFIVRTKEKSQHIVEAFKIK